MTLAEIEHQVKEIQIALEGLSQRLDSVHQQITRLLIAEREYTLDDARKHQSYY